MSYSSLSDNGMLQIFSFFNQIDYMEPFKTVSAYSWLFIHFRKYWNLSKTFNTRWIIVKTTLIKFFRCMAHLGFNCNIVWKFIHFKFFFNKILNAMLHKFYFVQNFFLIFENIASFLSIWKYQQYDNFVKLKI